MKRLLDLVVALTALVLSSPILLLVSGVVFLEVGRPILFVQRRPGLHSKLFNLYKFRTMAAGEGSDEARLTPTGRLLRKFSLDELPEFWNVVKGDMSLVGPRPLLEEYLPLYSTAQTRRHEVRPGLTGWAQINGRNAVPWEERFEMDVWYVDNHSLALDLRILFKSVALVLKGEGISAPGESTMPKFTGTAE